MTEIATPSDGFCEPTLRANVPGAVAGLTVVVAVAWLSAGSGSGSAAATEAVFVSVPSCVGVTTIVTVADAPTARLPRAHATVAVPVHVPWLGVADTRSTLAGSGSLKETPVAGCVPLFFTVSV